MASTATTKAPAQPEQQRCIKCHRILRNASPDGLGPKCRGRVRKATKAPAMAAFKPALVEKAVEMLEQGAVQPLRKSGKNEVFLVVSEDGSQTYRTARAACTCKAGLRGQHMCKHRIAVIALTVRATAEQSAPIALGIAA
ncbi:SWIM zinc finger family protein [Streptomyces sp. NRRL S-350]|uniref:SWIM zinc finger family protein n=1 Tax=Streptomyces sp. NRRL S-350 TaxID=1463902 RepID=UPI0007C59A31|nr:SWIM zinc finger family protein [Streptomyces sp. NRRL S-350]